MAISKTKATAAGIVMMILLMGGAAVVVNEMVTRPKPLAVAVPIRPATQPAEVILDPVPALTAERFLTEITLQQPAIVPAKPCAYVAKQQNANTQNCTDCHAAVNKILVQPQVLLPLNGVTLNKVNGGMLAIDTTFKINDLAQFIILDAAPDTNGLPAGTVAPAFEVGRFDGKKVRLEDFKGKFVLLNFWDSTSAAAKEQMPHLRAAARDWSNEPNLVIIGINVDEKAARNFAKEERMDWMSGIGDAKVMQDYHLGVGGAVLIGPDGKIINGSVSGLGIDDALDKALRVGPAVPDTTEKRPAQPDLQNK